MGFFAYAMAIAFVVIWAILLYKLVRVVSSNKQKDDELDED